MMSYDSAHLGALLLFKPGRSCSINGENRTGEKGAACQKDSPLGHSRKGSPCIDCIPSGAVETLMDTAGSGVIQHIWFTVTDETEKGRFVLRDLVLRMYWDGEETPSVETPLGDFFLNGFARGYEVCSLPMTVNPRRGMNCYLPMPFSSHARITLENQHAGEIRGLFFQIDYTLYDEPLQNAGTLHAQWRRQKLTALQEDYVLLDGVQSEKGPICPKATSAAESRIFCISGWRISLRTQKPWARISPGILWMVMNMNGGIGMWRSPISSAGSPGRIAMPAVRTKSDTFFFFL